MYIACLILRSVVTVCTELKSKVTVCTELKSKVNCLWPCHGDICGEVEVQVHTFLTLALGGGKWSTAFVGCFILGKNPPLPIKQGGWVGPESSMDIFRREKSLSHAGNQTAGSPSMQRSHCTDCSPGSQYYTQDHLMLSLYTNSPAGKVYEWWVLQFCLLHMQYRTLLAFLLQRWACLVCYKFPVFFFVNDFTLSIVFSHPYSRSVMLSGIFFSIFVLPVCVLIRV